MADEKNKMLIESYKLTTVRDSIGIYGQRLILRLVQMANNIGYVEGVDMEGGPDLRQVQRNLFGEATFTFPLSDLMGTSEEYTAVKRSVRRLMQQVIEYEDGDRWIAFPFLSRVEFDRQHGAKVQVQPELYQALLDFTKGFRRFELQAALKMKSTYSLRLYQLMAGQEDPLTYTIEELRLMLARPEDGKKAPYSKPSDFVKYVLDPAKAELDECSPYSFRYELNRARTGKGGRPAIVSVTLYPIHQVRFEDPDLHPASHSLFLSGLTMGQKNILMHKFEFSKKMLQNNLPLFETAAKSIDLTAWLDSMARRVSRQRPKNPQGYVVRALQMELEAQGIEY